MERIVSIHAVYTASIKSVTDLTEPVCSVVRKEKAVIEVCVYHFHFLFLFLFLFFVNGHSFYLYHA